MHKGGPDTGIFIQLVDRPRSDLKIPEAAHSFGDLIEAQSLGDYRALHRRGRRVLRIHLGANAVRGLQALANALA
jgi:transaldolase/glucose-6-phosphate isomerase